MAELSEIKDKDTGAVYGLKDTEARRIGRNFANWGMPILYLNGDTTGMSKDNAVDLAYMYANRSGTASVKWQGSSAVDLGKAFGKFNYTIKFDTAFEVKEGWGERKKYCLKANWIDASQARNLLAAKLWGQMCAARTTPDSTLADCPNWGAVDGFPCIIVLNGEFLGVFTWNVPKDGWMMNMPHDGATRECIVCAEDGDPAKFKAIATLDGSDFDIEYITDEDNTGWAVESINRAISACMNSDGSDIDTVIAQYVDIDSAIDYLIFCAVTANMDGMDRNYLLSTTDGVKWRFTGYDMDTTFGLYWAGKGFTTADDYPFPSNFANTHRLMYLLYNYKADAVKARYKELRARVLSEIRIAYEALNFVAEIPRVALNAEAEKWPLVPSSGINTVYQIIEYLRMRFLRLDSHVEAMVQKDPIPAPMLLAQHGWFDDNAATIGQAEVTKVSFVPSYTETGTEEASWACDVNKTGAIMAYQNDTEVTVAPTNGASKILVNKDSTFMFAVRGAGNEAYGNFASLASVTGTEMFVAQDGTNMQEICNGNKVLTSKIYVPDGVVNIKKAFADCIALTETPALPDSVTQMDSAMFKCSGLTKLPNIPASAVSMEYAFQDCYGITDVNGVVIPESVTNMVATFFNLRNASGVVEINAQNITEYTNAFLNAAADANQITLTGSCPLLAELAATNTAGKVTVEQ